MALLKTLAFRMLRTASRPVLRRRSPPLIVLGSEEHLRKTGFHEVLAFYLPMISPQFVDPRQVGRAGSSSWLAVLRSLLAEAPVLIAEDSPSEDWAVMCRRIEEANLRPLDPCTNPWVAWTWHCLVNELYPPPPPTDADRQRFGSFVDGVRAREGDMARSYVFGTGPSLGRVAGMATEGVWRIACNTIVRDRELWHAVKPHVLVAADPGYHFGPTVFARAFRHDLAQRLGETRTAFVYPRQYEWLVRREFGDVTDLLFPVPLHEPEDGDWGRCDLLRNYTLLTNRNVLLYMLQVAATVSSEINLWGFDGKAPNDVLFWTNSERQNYRELMWSLHEGYPAFYEESVPANDGAKYTREVMGDSLEMVLSEMEAAGKTIRMLHKSWTEPLGKRFAAEEKPLISLHDE